MATDARETRRLCPLRFFDEECPQGGYGRDGCACRDDEKIAATMPLVGVRCDRCDGSGRVVRAVEFMFNGQQRIEDDCPKCEGIGYVAPECQPR